MAENKVQSTSITDWDCLTRVKVQHSFHIKLCMELRQQSFDYATWATLVWFVTEKRISINSQINRIEWAYYIRDGCEEPMEIQEWKSQDGVQESARHWDNKKVTALYLGQFQNTFRFDLLWSNVKMSLSQTKILYHMTLCEGLLKSNVKTFLLLIIFWNECPAQPAHSTLKNKKYDCDWLHCIAFKRKPDSIFEDKRKRWGNCTRFRFWKKF